MLMLRRSLHTRSPLYGKWHHPRVSATVSKNFKKNMDKMVMDDMKRMEKEAARKGPRTVPKHPILYDNNRTKVFNRKFFESIGLVMSQIPDLLGKGISITRVNVMQDFSEVRVFWVSKEKEEEVAELLRSTNTMIRRGMGEFAGLGQIPKIVFVMDTNHLLSVQMDRLFTKLDTGPDIVPVHNIWLEAGQLELGSGAGGGKRDEILRRVEMALMKSKATHRIQYSPEQFNEVYRESIERFDMK